MRILILTTILAFAAVHHEAILEHGARLLAPDDAPEVAAAIELRCGDAAGLDRQHCEADLRDAFETGTSDAGAIVRLHCTHFENGWAEDRDRSPICATVREG